jgi:hypothetical protein
MGKLAKMFNKSNFTLAKMFMKAKGKKSTENFFVSLADYFNPHKYQDISGYSSNKKRRKKKPLIF